MEPDGPTSEAGRRTRRVAAGEVGAEARQAPDTSAVDEDVPAPRRSTPMRVSSPGTAAHLQAELIGVLWLEFRDDLQGQALDSANQPSFAGRDRAGGRLWSQASAIFFRLSTGDCTMRRPSSVLRSATERGISWHPRQGEVGISLASASYSSRRSRPGGPPGASFQVCEA